MAIWSMTVMAYYCDECGAEFFERPDSCPHCNNQEAAPKAGGHCPRCGAAAKCISEGAKASSSQCGKCGYVWSWRPTEGKEAARED